MNNLNKYQMTNQIFSNKTSFKNYIFLIICILPSTVFFMDKFTINKLLYTFFDSLVYYLELLNGFTQF